MNWKLFKYLGLCPRPRSLAHSFPGGQRASRNEKSDTVMPPSRKPRTPLRSLSSVAVSCERVKHHDYTEQKEAESRAEVPQVSFTRGLSIRCHFYSWWLKYSFTKVAQILLSTWLRFSLTFTSREASRCWTWNRW